MCAVFGWIKKKGSFSASEIQMCRKALKTMKHRGPDYTGEIVLNDVFMGHNRLKIIDLSDNANQPFLSEDGRFILSFNGEIYNYLELRRDLEKEGVDFRTSSDTEVLLKKFIKEKEASFSALDGMFAGAVFDKISKRHCLFRDHLGQKPLYYFEYPEGIIYASELRAFLSLDLFRWKLDSVNFLKFLVNSCYMWDTTPVEGIKKLLPGYYLTIEKDKAANTLHRYWDSVPGKDMLDIGFDEAVQRIECLLDDSCRKNMRADVPYGLFLSGGIDSSLLLGYCQKFNPGISSFNVAMSEDDFDESKKAKSATDYLKTEPCKIYQMDPDVIRDSLDSFFSFSDEPHGDPGFVNSYFLAKSCRSDIVVGLAGDGADELFSGYITFEALSWEGVFKKLPGYLIRGLEYFAKNSLSTRDFYMGNKFKVLCFLQGFPADASVRFPLWLGAISPEELSRLCPWKERRFFSRNGQADTIFEDVYKMMSVTENRTRNQALSYYYQKFFLSEFICMHTDRAAMQSSLEVRSPYLSVPLVEFANRLPDSFKINYYGLKHVLRYVMQARGFPETIYRQKKQGFTFPVARWLKTILRQKLEKDLDPQEWSNNLIDSSYVKFLKEEHLGGKRNNYHILFNLIVFKEWLKRYPNITISL